MSKNLTQTNETAKEPLSITAEEFDAKFDAGEDVSDYLDWNNSVMVAPGKLSPGQKLSLLEEMIDKLLADKQSVTSMLAEQFVTTISMPVWMHFEIAKEAARQQTSRDALIQAWLSEKVTRQEAIK